MNQSDRDILRALAETQMRYAASPEMKETIRLWKRHGAFNQERPMVTLELWTLESEFLEPRLRCVDPQARELEAQLLRFLIPFEDFGDDQVVPDFFPVQWRTWFRLFDQDAGAAINDPRHLGQSFGHLINDLEEDLPKLRPSRWGVDREATLRQFALAEAAFGDILPVRMTMGSLASEPTQKVVHRMGMEEMCVAVCECPEAFSELMGRIADDFTAYFRWLEAENLLLPTEGCSHLAQGSYCYNEELPTACDHPLKTTDVWGYMDSQETLVISPAMFGELVFPCYQRIAASFGLLSYGCCEPVHRVWDDYISTLPNLRKVSISPWCDETFMGERLRGRRIMYHRKPSPNFLGVGAELDEDGVREHFRKTLLAAQGCTLEISQRDVYTTTGHPEKARRYIEIIRECIDRWWKG